MPGSAGAGDGPPHRAAGPADPAGRQRQDANRYDILLRRASRPEWLLSGPLVDRTDPTDDYRKGKWLHTLSGQVFPTIRIGSQGDVWRILNASGSRSYALTITQQDTGATVPMQILSIDGVALTLSPNASPSQIATLIGKKAQLMPCPGAAAIGSGGALCAATIYSMPSSRVDVRIVRTDFADSDEPAILQTLAYPTGDNGNGDLWPQINLAKVTLAQRDATTKNTVAVRNALNTMVGSGGTLTGPVSVRVPGTTTSVSPSNPAAHGAGDRSGGPGHHARAAVCDHAAAARRRRFRPGLRAARGGAPAQDPVRVSDADDVWAGLRRGGRERQRHRGDAATDRAIRSVGRDGVRPATVQRRGDRGLGAAERHQRGPQFPHPSNSVCAARGRHSSRHDDPGCSGRLTGDARQHPCPARRSTPRTATARWARCCRALACRARRSWPFHSAKSATSFSTATSSSTRTAG